MKYMEVHSLFNISHFSHTGEFLYHSDQEYSEVPYSSQKYIQREREREGEIDYI